jgi:hypothetical protein
MGRRVRGRLWCGRRIVGLVLSGGREGWGGVDVGMRWVVSCVVSFFFFLFLYLSIAHELKVEDGACQAFEFCKGKS